MFLKNHSAAAPRAFCSKCITQCHDRYGWLRSGDDCNLFYLIAPVMFQSNVWHGFGRIEVGSCHARCSTSWVATFFFERLLHSWCVSCMQRSAHIWVFSSAPFFLLCSFGYVCACMTFITCMIMHCVFLLTLALQNLFASHSWNMHAYMHACMHACIINIMHVARGYLAQTCVVIWLILSRHHFWLPHGPTRMESRKEPCSIPSSRFPRTTRSNGVGYPVVV